MTMLIISCIFVARAYQILVDNMCLITTRDSVSDQATETWSGYWKGTVRTTFPRNLSPAFLCDAKLKTQLFTKNIWAHILKSNFSLNNAPKESFCIHDSCSGTRGSRDSHASRVLWSSWFSASLSLCFSASFVLSRSPVLLFSASAFNWLSSSLYELREPENQKTIQTSEHKQHVN